MKCLIKHLGLLCGWMALAGLSAGAVTLPSDWQREQSFNVSTTGLVKISLPVETLNAARPGLEDVRVYDDAGKEAPYLIERPMPVAKAVQAAKSFRVSLGANITVITVETGLDQALDGVTLETPEMNFIKAVSVEGSADGSNWQTLAQGQPIFRQPYGASLLRVPFAAGVWPWLRLVIDDQRSQPIPFTGARVHAANGEAAPGEWIPVKISERDENPGETRLALDLGWANLDLANIQLQTTEPLFMRYVAIAASQVSEDSIREQIIGQGAIYRLAGEGQTPSENLSVPLEYLMHSRELLLLIKNGDSPPLPVSAVRVERRLVYLIFRVRQPGLYHLLVGNGRCAAPRYDLAALNMNLKMVAVSSIQLPPPSDNPDYRASELLPGVEIGGVPLDVSEWKFRKEVKISKAGVQQVELDAEVLAHAGRDFADLRLLRGSNQAPYIIQRTSIARALTPTVTVATDVKNPKLTRWIIKLPQRGLPLTRLSCVSRTPLFNRAMSLYEELSDDRGDQYRHPLGNGSWQQTPEDKSREFSLALDGTMQGDTLFLETENGDNPPIELEKFQLFYPATRILFRAKPDGPLFLYYGNPRVAAPRYDLSLVANQLLSAEKNVSSLGPEERLRESSWRERPAAGQGGAVLWGALAAVVVALLVIISRLLPKTQASQ